MVTWLQKKTWTQNLLEVRIKKKWYTTPNWQVGIGEDKKGYFETLGI